MTFDSYLQTWPSCPPFFCSQLDQLPNSFLVKHLPPSKYIFNPLCKTNFSSRKISSGFLKNGTNLKRVILQNSFGYINRKKLANIISTVSKSHLCKIIGPKWEELCFLSNLSVKQQQFLRVESFCRLHNLSIMYVLPLLCYLTLVVFCWTN